MLAACPDEARRGRPPTQPGPRVGRAHRRARSCSSRRSSWAEDHLTMTEADLPLLGEHDLDAVHCRILTSGTSGRLRDRSGSRTATTSGARLARPSTSASIPVIAGSAACRSITSPASDRHALGDLRHRRDRPRRLRPGSSGRRARAPGRHARLLGHHAALASARRGRRPLGSAGDPDRRRARAAGGARGGDRAGREGGPDVRSDGGRLAGDDARRSRTRGESSARRAVRCSRPTCGSRTARSWSRALSWRRGAPTRTAGCTPATSEGSTTRASCTSRTGSAT